MILYFLYWNSFTYLLSKDIDLLVKPLRNQFIGFLFGLGCFFILVLNFPPLCYSLYFHCFTFILFFILFFFLFLFSLLPLFIFSSSSFCFFYPGFPYFSLYYFLHSSDHLIIITSPVLQLS